MGVRGDGVPVAAEDRTVGPEGAHDGLDVGFDLGASRVVTCDIHVDD